MLFHEQQLRKIPTQFSWLDQRLVQESYIDRLSHPAMGLYLFLVTVADPQGVSFYSDKTLQKRLQMSAEVFGKARLQLLKDHLIAYQKPFYQVLGLDSLPATSSTGKDSPITPFCGEIVTPTAASKEIALRELAELAQHLRQKP